MQIKKVSTKMICSSMPFRSWQIFPMLCIFNEGLMIFLLALPLLCQTKSDFDIFFDMYVNSWNYRSSSWHNWRNGDQDNRSSNDCKTRDWCLHCQGEVYFVLVLFFGNLQDNYSIMVLQAATEHSMTALSGILKHSVPDDWLGTMIRFVK